MALKGRLAPVVKQPATLRIDNPDGLFWSAERNGFRFDVLDGLRKSATGHYVEKRHLSNSVMYGPSLLVSGLSAVDHCGAGDRNNDEA